MKNTFGMALLATAIGFGFATSALADETTTGYSGSGLKVKNGNYSLAISTNMQQRLVIVDNHDGSGNNGGDSINFHIRRLKTSFKGNVFNKKWSYGFTFDWTGGTPNVENAAIGYKLSDSLKLSLGSTKLNFNLEEKTSSSRQTFVDRSMANEAFNHDFATGLWLSGGSKMGEGKLDYEFGIYNGAPDGSARFNNRGDHLGGANSRTNFLLNARVGLAPFSDGKNIQKYMSDLRSDEDRQKFDLYMALGANYQMIGDDEGELGDHFGTGNSYDGTQGSVALDMRMHYQGLSVNASLFYTDVSIEEIGATGEDAAHASGFNLTAGYNMNLESGDQFEIAARISMVNTEDGSFLDRRWVAAQAASTNVGSNDEYDGTEAGLAFNYRFSKDKLKATLDANYFSLDDNNGENDDQWRFRFQLQLKF